MMGAHLSFEKGLEFYQSRLVFQLAAKNMMGKPAGLRGKFHYLLKLEAQRETSFSGIQTAIRQMTNAVK